MPLISGTPRWQKIATFVILIAILILAWFIYTRVGSQNEAVSATRDSVERTDCARRVNAEQSIAKDTATLSDRAVSRYYFRTLLDQAATQSRVTQAQIDSFASLVKMADDADAVVAALPDPAKEVERRCPG